MNKIIVAIALITLLCLFGCTVNKNSVSKVERLQEEFAGSCFYCFLGGSLSVDTEIALNENGIFSYRYGTQKYSGKWEISPNAKYIFIKGYPITKLIVIGENMEDINNFNNRSIGYRLHIKNKNTLVLFDSNNKKLWTYRRRIRQIE